MGIEFFAAFVGASDESQAFGKAEWDFGGAGDNCACVGIGVAGPVFWKAGPGSGMDRAEPFATLDRVIGRYEANEDADENDAKSLEEDHLRGPICRRATG